MYLARSLIFLSGTPFEPDLAGIIAITSLILFAYSFLSTLTFELKNWLTTIIDQNIEMMGVKTTKHSKEEKNGRLKTTSRYWQ